MKQFRGAVIHRWVRTSLRFTAAAIFLSCSWPVARADAPPAVLSLRTAGTSSEGAPQFSLEWDAASNTLYRLQSRPGLESNTMWETFDLAVPQGAKGLFKVTPDKAEAGSESVRRQFFQVLAPQPEIFSVQIGRAHV